MIDRSRKDKLPALRNVPKKELLEETAKVDKVLSKFKTRTNVEEKVACKIRLKSLGRT